MGRHAGKMPPEQPLFSIAGPGPRRYHPAPFRGAGRPVSVARQPKIHESVGRDRVEAS